MSDSEDDVKKMSNSDNSSSDSDSDIEQRNDSISKSASDNDQKADSENDSDNEEQSASKSNVMQDSDNEQMVDSDNKDSDNDQKMDSDENQKADSDVEQKADSDNDQKADSDEGKADSDSDDDKRSGDLGSEQAATPRAGETMQLSSSDNEDSIGETNTKIPDDSSSSGVDEPKEQKKSDLFGDMSSDDSDHEEKTAIPDAGSDGMRSPGDSPVRGIASPKSDDEQKQEETRIEVQIPKINTNLGENIHFVRFPNFLSVEPRPFDAEFYEDEAEEDDELDEEGRTRLKLKVENTIRWRRLVDSSGNETTQSNARIVKWSDGTQSLIVGSEKFDMNTMPLIGDFNHLFIRQGTGLQGQAVFRTKLTFRPYSTNSLTHRKMMGRLAHRINHSQQKVKVIPVTGTDPNMERLKLVREAEEANRAEQRREAARQKVRDRQMRKGVSADYLEENEDDENSYSLNAIKQRYRENRTPRHESSSEDELTNRRGSLVGLSSDDDDDDIDTRKRSRHPSQDSNSSDTKKTKRKVINDSDDESGSDTRNSNNSDSD